MAQKDRCPTCGSLPRTVWTYDAILEACSRWNQEHGKPPVALDWARASAFFPSYKTVIDYYGTWNKMLCAAGYKPNSVGGQPTWTRQAALDSLTPWIFQHGRIPYARDWKKSVEGRPSLGQVERLFGSWNAFLTVAGYETKEELQNTGRVFGCGGDGDEKDQPWMKT